MTAWNYDLGIMRGTEVAPNLILGVGVLRKGFLGEVMMCQ